MGKRAWDLWRTTIESGAVKDKATWAVRGLTKEDLRSKILGFILKDQYFDYYHSTLALILYVFLVSPLPRHNLYTIKCTYFKCTSW